MSTLRLSLAIPVRINNTQRCHLVAAVGQTRPDILLIFLLALCPLRLPLPLAWMLATTMMHTTTTIQSNNVFVFSLETVEEATVSHDTLTLFLYIFNLLGIMSKSIFCEPFLVFSSSIHFPKTLLVINHKTLRFYGLQE